MHLPIVRFGIAVAASIAVAACGGSSKKTVDAGDARASEATPDVGMDTSVPGRDSAADQPLASGEAGSTDDVPPKETAADEAGVDGSLARHDVEVMDVGLAGVVDGRGDAYGEAGAIDAQAGASLTVNPTKGDFGITMGAPSDPIVFTVSNVGSIASGSPKVTTSGCKFMKITGNSCVAPVPPGESCKVTMVFDAPGGAGGCSGSLIIVAEGFPGGQVTIPLSGEVP